MFPRVEAAAGEMEVALAELEPKAMIGTQPADCLKVIDRHERVVAAARLRVTARAEQMRQWEREGYRSFEEWYAATLGTSPGQARRKTSSAKKLVENRRTADALADGDISEDEADVIADAAAKNPEAETKLLDTAKNKNRSHKDLQDEAAKAQASGESDSERARRLRGGRSAHGGLDRDGFWGLHARFEPQVGAEIKSKLAASTDRFFTRARRNGNREELDRYRADALAALILGRDPHTQTRNPANPHPATAADRARRSGALTPSDPDSQLFGESQLDLGLHPRPEPGTDPIPTDPAPSPLGAADGPRTRAGREMVLVIDLAALRRGCVHPGETCHIRGVGPVPVEVARAWVEDAFVKAVIRDGTDVKKVAHYGRHVPATVRTALGLINPTCSVPGCANPRVELDHQQRYADRGPSSVANLRPLCVHHHRQRTHDGYELTGEPGDRRWLGPDGRVLLADQPHHLTAEPARAP